MAPIHALFKYVFQKSPFSIWAELLMTFLLRECLNLCHLSYPAGYSWEVDKLGGEIMFLLTTVTHCLTSMGICA